MMRFLNKYKFTIVSICIIGLITILLFTPFHNTVTDTYGLPVNSIGK